ncbi:MAG TPA: DUF5916 domain-containing protein [Gemmatimonadaceae bacterium]|nr:DUF5916 domain-containing protein [Gemmatimonadaceae bacterium]
MKKIVVSWFAGALTAAAFGPLAGDAAAQSRNVHPTPAPSVRAAAKSGAIAIDGRLDEAAWAAATPATEFRQSQPSEGAAATQRTEIRFLFDDDALYVGARMYDSLGAAGVRRALVRRDQLNESLSDYIQLSFDTYHDHVSSATFLINPSGSIRDGTGDPTWDPVWQSGAAVDSLGWTAEMRIPFSQLNFSRDIDQTWGLQVIRWSHARNERTHLAWWPSNEPGGPARYAHLEGMRVASRPRGMEVVPYVVTQANYVRPASAANPFTDPSEFKYRVGGDVKYRLTSNLTLNATINPDFGQVEVDPAVVNLSTFETFFQERRPFFIEGANAFGFGNFSCFFCSNSQNLGMFYTRRIGRRPQLSPAGTFVDVPDNTTILGAAKITGRLKNRMTVGFLDAITRREDADVMVEDASGRRFFSREAEPMSNYFVGRVRRDYKDGTYRFGSILTSVDRFTDDSLALNRLAGHARGLGFDWDMNWKNRRYTFMGQYALSDVRGSDASILRLQRSSARYFQKPDREHGGNGLFSDALDAGADRLSGYGGYARFAKEGGEWVWESAVNYRSPGFEVNDIAFLTRSDYFWHNLNVARSVQRPSKLFRNYFLVAGGQQQFNYDGDLIERQMHAGIFGQFANYWPVNLFVIRQPETYEDRLTRGGPTVRRRGSTTFFAFLGTDARKPISFSTNPRYGFSEAGTVGYSYDLQMTYKPADNVQLSLGPSYNVSGSPYQFVTAGADPTATDFYGTRYVFAELRQTQLSMNTRVNVTFTPRLTFEAFMQPLLASGDYFEFREFVKPRQSAMRNFTPGTEIVTSTTASGATRYTVDADGAGTAAQPISFGEPDFNFRSLRGNAVLRWEYRPGSTLFFVWQQNRASSAAVGDFDFSRDRTALFGAHPDNIFLIKASYWFGF